MYSFLKHKIKKNFIFIDNLDFKLLKSVDIKKNPSKFLFIIISKSGNTTETILNAGDFTAVKPGLYHTFEGLEDGVAFELYWANFLHNDIERESVGHLKDTDGKIVRLDKKKK